MMSESAIDRSPSIDWMLSIKLANNNRALAKDLLGMFINDLSPAANTIHAAFAGQNYPETLSLVHKLHGASCYCGVTNLKTLLARMEFTLREKMYSQFSELLNEFDKEVDHILDFYPSMTME